MIAALGFEGTVYTSQHWAAVVLPCAQGRNWGRRKVLDEGVSCSIPQSWVIPKTQGSKQEQAAQEEEPKQSVAEEKSDYSDVARWGLLKKKKNLRRTWKQKGIVL